MTMTLEEKAKEAWADYCYRAGGSLYSTVFEDAYIQGATEALASQKESEPRFVAGDKKQFHNWRKMKTKLTKEESVRLIALGVSADKASASKSCVAYGNGARGIAKAPTAPIFTIADILSMLPKSVCHNGLDCKFRITSWCDEPYFAGYQNQVGVYITPDEAPFSAIELIDALYELLCWVIQKFPTYTTYLNEEKL